eukprot:TRINITY_DN2838_c1_g1_i1.p1 TRINITY_DN2838_c1_g1~~TRINITY_DN2838_c1_g1_i1.p1  ORF type:complete len:683 (+),score=117.33 TRINITY_DN2838_c1_g1_i1:69-2051(+)
MADAAAPAAQAPAPPPGGLSTRTLSTRGHAAGHQLPPDDDEEDDYQDDFEGTRTANSAEAKAAAQAVAAEEAARERAAAAAAAVQREAEAKAAAERAEAERLRLELLAAARDAVASAACAVAAAAAADRAPLLLCCGRDFAGTAARPLCLTVSDLPAGVVRCRPKHCALGRRHALMLAEDGTLYGAGDAAALGLAKPPAAAAQWRTQGGALLRYELCGGRVLRSENARRTHFVAELRAADGGRRVVARAAVRLQRRAAAPGSGGAPAPASTDAQGQEEAEGDLLPADPAESTAVVSALRRLAAAAGLRGEGLPPSPRPQRFSAEGACGSPPAAAGPSEPAPAPLRCLSACFPPGVRVADCACGDEHSVAVLEDGSVWACGANDHGQLGVGDRLPRAEWCPVPPPDDTWSASSVRCGDYHTVVLYSGKGAASCGYNGHGQLGVGDTEPRLQLTPLAGEVAASVAPGCWWGGPHHALCCTPDGAVYGVGHNRNGELGLGDCRNRPELTAIPALSGLLQLSVPGDDRGGPFVVCGCHHTVAVLQSGLLVAAGDNTHGQLGLGTADRCGRAEFEPVPPAALDWRRVVALAAGHGFTAAATTAPHQEGQPGAVEDDGVAAYICGREQVGGGPSGTFARSRTLCHFAPFRCLVAARDRAAAVVQLP